MIVMTMASDLFVTLGDKKILNGPYPRMSEGFLQRSNKGFITAQKTSFEQCSGDGDIRPAFSNTGFDVSNAVSDLDVEIK